MEVYKALLSSHDFFYFVAKELKIGVPSDIISNTALLYAMNTHVLSVQRTVSENIPHYTKDMDKFAVYCTSAQISLKNIIVTSRGSHRWDGISRELKRFSYNAVHTVSQVTDSRQAVPAMGYYMKYAPLTSFEFFLLGGKGSSVIRLGKKLPPARVEYQKLRNIEIKNGIFIPSHPVNAKDLSKSIEVLSCEVEIIPPTPHYRNCKLRGDYLKGEVGGDEYYIALPDKNLYPKVYT